jgi:cellulose synthase/poly-beta-1,6-N-acetylglucosamine synthase-like glycosyltransferase
VARATTRFFESVYLPRRALIVALAVLAALAAAVLAGRAVLVRPVDLGPLCRALCGAIPHVERPLSRLASMHHRELVAHPLDMSWLFYLTFVLVYTLQIGPVLIFGVLARRPQPFASREPSVRFLCLVPAHNEARVIANSVSTLIRQQYPRHLFDVWVISDASTDGTDAIARREGARVLRTGTRAAGKYKALAYAFDRLLRDDDRRYVCVIDADNGVAPDFFREMNNAILARGYRCLQGFHDVLNGSANWITKSLWLNCIASSVFYNPGRFRSLGTALICGTGWCCEAGLLRRYWKYVETQTEDIELTGVLLLHEGIGVAWVASAHVYDEKPLRLWTAIRQRQRWMTGHMRVAGRLFWPLLREGVRRRDARCLELAAYYLLPFAMNAGNLQMLLVLGMNLGLLAVQGPLGWTLWQWGVTAVTLSYVFIYQIVGFAVETGLWGRAIVYSLYCAIFSFLAWMPALVWACFSVRRSDWMFHTPHVAAQSVAAIDGMPSGRLRAS